MSHKPQKEKVKKQKKLTLKEQLEKDPEGVAKQIEMRNFEKARAARKKLQDAETVHKKTTKEILKQNKKQLKNEKLENMKFYEIAEQAEKAKENAMKLEYEKHAFNPLVGANNVAVNADNARNKAMQLGNENNAFNPCNAIKGFFREFKSKLTNKNIKRVPEDEDEEEDEITISSGPSIKSNPNATAEEKKTDEELRKMLHIVRNLKKHNKIQSRASKKQEKKLKNIKITADEAKKSVKKTRDVLRKEHLGE